MRDIIIEMKKFGCTLVDAKSGGYIKTYARYSTAQKKAEEMAQGGKVILKSINE